MYVILIITSSGHNALFTIGMATKIAHRNYICIDPDIFILFFIEFC